MNIWTYFQKTTIALLLISILKYQQHACLDHIFIKNQNACFLSKINADVLLMDIKDDYFTVVSIPLNMKIKVTENKINVIDYDR